MEQGAGINDSNQNKQSGVKILCLLRHAKSDWSKACLDKDRSLSKCCARDAGFLGRQLRAKFPTGAMAILQFVQKSDEPFQLQAGKGHLHDFLIAKNLLNNQNDQRNDRT